MVLKKETYRITRLSCASCAAKAESSIKNLNGVTEVQVNFALGTLDVAFDDTVVDLTVFEKVLAVYEYRLRPFNSSTADAIVLSHAKRMKVLMVKTIIAFAFTLPVFVISMFYMHQMQYQQWLLLMLSIPVVFYCGWEFHSNTIKSLRKFKFDMDVLISISTLTAFIFSLINSFNFGNGYWNSHPLIYFESATVIISFILLGRLIEERAKQSTSKDIGLLLQKQPRQVSILEKGQEVLISIDEVKEGDIVCLKPGNIVPVDGVICDGAGFIDESMYSGEPLPVEKAEGDKLISGTLVENGVLLMHAATTGEGSTFKRIVNLIKDAQKNKPPVQHLADRIAAVFVPVVCGIAILVFFIWLLSGYENAFEQAISAFVSVLVISCPCALGLALPTAFVAGLGKAYKHGILIKNLKTLEKSGKINSIGFDKTGTLTVGNIKVHEISWMNGIQGSEYLSMLYVVASMSEHPLSKAIMRHCNVQNVLKLDIVESTYFKSAGIKVVTNSQVFLLGNMRLMKDHDVSISDEILLQIKAHEEKANTVVFFSMGKALLAYVVLSDEVKEGAALMIKKLKQDGYKIALFTGDNHTAAMAVGRYLGISEINSNMTFEEKGDLILQKQKSGEIVAFVGDGINDAYAMKLADIGIAMEQGAAVAIETADVVLMRHECDLLIRALKISRLTYSTIKQNFIWAFLYNIIAIPVAAGVLFPIAGISFNPMIAGIAMALSSLSVVINSLRLKFKHV